MKEKKRKQIFFSLAKLRISQGFQFVEGQSQMNYMETEFTGPLIPTSIFIIADTQG